MQMLRKNIKPEGGALFLLLIVLSLFSLKTALGSGQVQRPLTGDARFIEIAGDIPNPGVIRFFEPVTLKAVMDQVSIPDAKRPLFGVDLDSVLPSGTRVDFKDTMEGFAVDPGKMSAFYRMTLGMPVNLNNASAVELTAIPGIGPGLAASIVDEREKRQGFHALDELTEISGISRKSLKKFSPFLVL